MPNMIEDNNNSSIRPDVTMDIVSVSADDDLPLLTTETGTNSGTCTTTTEDGSTAGTAEENWLQLELEMLERMSVRTQTLEEIMAENDFPLEEDDMFLFPSGPMEDGCSSAAATGPGTQLPPMGRYGAVPTEMPNNYQLSSSLVLRREDTISSQILSANATDQKEGHGHPTVICVGQSLLAIGTSLGHCLLFEKGGQQKLVYSFHSNDLTFGSIACLDFSSDQNRLCAGFNMGALMIVRPQGSQGKILLKSNDVVQPGRGILHVKYISGHTVLIVDSGGNVYEYHERRLQKRKENVRCLFTGCKGEVTNIGYVYTDDGVELLVLATFYQAMLLSIKRRGATVGQIRLHGSPLLPALIDWREHRIRVISHATIHDLRLCIARDQEARIYQVRQRVGGDLLFPLVQIVQFTNPLINLKWLDDRSILALITEKGAEQLQLIELQQQQQSSTTMQSDQRKSVNNQLAIPIALEEIIGKVQLIYNSADFKGLATGQNVSQAMQNLADSVCYHSIARHPTDDQAYILGQNGIFLAHLVEQRDQLNSLVKCGDFVSALLFAMDICTGQVRTRATKRGGGTNFRAKVFREIPSLVCQLLDKTMDGLESGHIDELIAHYKRNFYVLLRACLLTSHFDLLYNTVYTTIQKDCLCRSIFLELLEEFVLDGQLDQPPPALVNDYLNYLLSEGQLPQFEQSITKLPVECMDLHQVITACREHQLFDGICYVMNQAIRDYLGPLQEMFEHMQRFVHKEVLSDLEISQGNKLLLYLNCCLAGRAYPYGDLPDEHLAQTVPLETYKFLVQLRPNFTIASTPSPSPPPPTATDRNPRIASESSSMDLRRFPHLNVLLRFDAQQFLNVISTCADATVFTQCKGRLKRLVDVLISKCVEDESVGINTGDGGDLCTELGPLLITFVSGLLEKGAIPKDICLLTQLIERVLQRHFPNIRAQKATEQSIVELLKIVPEINLDQMLQIAQTLPYVHICAYIFTVRKEYVRLLECCLQDPFEPTNVFPILSDLLITLREECQQAELKKFVQKNLHKLSTLDAKLTANLLLENFPEMLAEFRSKPKQLPLPLLQQCFQIRREQGYRTLTGSEEEQDGLLFDYFFEGTIERTLENGSNGAKDSLDMELADQLRYWLPLGSFSDHCLNVAMQQPNGLLFECGAILLVSRSHVTRAFEHLFNEGIQKEDNVSEHQKSQGDIKSRRMECSIRSMLELANAFPNEARQGNWLGKLFRHLLNTIGQEDDSGKTPGEVIQTHLLRPDSHFSRVFTAIMEQQQEEDGSIPMVSLVVELFSHPVFRNAPFSAFQSLFRQMLLWSEIRTIMQRCTRNCIGWELAERWRKSAWRKPAFTSTVPSAVCPPPSFKEQTKDQDQEDSLLSYGQQQQFCIVCGQRIFKSFFLFNCGHCLHLECVNDSQKQCPCKEFTGSISAKQCHEQQQRNFGTNPFTNQNESPSQAVNKKIPSEEERRQISAIFRNIGRDFNLRTGTAPPSSDEKIGHRQSSAPPVTPQKFFQQSY